MFNLRFNIECRSPEYPRRSGGIDSSPVREADSRRPKSVREALTVGLSPVAHKPSLERMGVATNRIVNVGSFTEGQKYFLNYHRDAVLLRTVRT